MNKNGIGKIILMVEHGPLIVTGGGGGGGVVLVGSHVDFNMIHLYCVIVRHVFTLSRNADNWSGF